MCQRFGFISDIGIGEEQVVRLLGKRGRVIDTLLHGPDLAGPVRGQRLALNDDQAILGLRVPGSRDSDVGCAVAALVIDQNDPERSGIFLRQERLDVLGNDRRFVARGHDRYDVRRRHERRIGPHAVPHIRKPEAAARGDQVKPDRQCERGNDRSRGHSYPALRMAFSTSVLPSDQTAPGTRCASAITASKDFSINSQSDSVMTSGGSSLIV